MDNAAGGDREHFDFHGVKVYAIPDYVYRADDGIHIHDWKSGKPRDEHRDQMALYGLWAHVRHKAPVDRTFVYLEYLANGRVAPAQLSEAELDRIRMRIESSVAEMREYLVGGDLERNEPVPKEEWDLAVDRRKCARCNFYELCKPELEAVP